MTDRPVDAEDGEVYRCIAPYGDGDLCDEPAVGRYKVAEAGVEVFADLCEDHAPDLDPEIWLGEGGESA